MSVGLGYRPIISRVAVDQAGDGASFFGGLDLRDGDDMGQLELGAR